MRSDKQSLISCLFSHINCSILCIEHENNETCLIQNYRLQEYITRRHIDHSMSVDCHPMMLIEECLHKEGKILHHECCPVRPNIQRLLDQNNCC